MTSRWLSENVSNKFGYLLFGIVTLGLLVAMGQAKNVFPAFSRVSAAEEQRFMYQDPEQRKKLWQQVDEAQNSGLPKTAIEHLEAI